MEGNTSSTLVTRQASFHTEWFAKDGGFLVLIAVGLAILGFVGLTIKNPCSAVIISFTVPISTDLFVLVLLWEASGRYCEGQITKAEHFQFPHKFTSLLLVLFLLLALVCSFGRLYALSGEVHTSTSPPQPLTDTLDAAYFSAVTITTLGYGDYVPCKAGARWLVMAELLSGALLLLLAFPIVASRLATFDDEKNERGHMLPWYREDIPSAQSLAAAAQLQVSSTPDGADIEIDGDFVGNTPSTVGVTVGQHEISVKRSGFKPWEREIAVSSGQVNVIAVLEPWAK